MSYYYKSYWWNQNAGRELCTKAHEEYRRTRKPCKTIEPPSYLLNLPGEVVIRLLKTILLTPFRVPRRYKGIDEYSRSLLTLECFLVAMPWFKRFVLFITDSDDPDWKQRTPHEVMHKFDWSDMVYLSGVEHVSLYAPSMSSEGVTLPGTFCMTGSSAPRLNVMYIWNSEHVAGTWKLTGPSSRSLYRKYLHLPQTVVFIVPWCASTPRMARSSLFGYEMVSRLASDANVPVIEHRCLTREHRPAPIVDDSFNIWFGTENYDGLRIKDVKKITSLITSSFKESCYILEDDECDMFLSSYYDNVLKIRLPSPCIARPILFHGNQQEEEGAVIPAIAQGCPAYFIAIPLEGVERVYIEFDTSRIPWLVSRIEANKLTMYQNTLLSLLNTSWDFQAPHGRTCGHAHLLNGDMRENDQAHWSFYTDLPPHSGEFDYSMANSPFHNVVYVGIPDMMLTRLTGWDNARFLYWKRLAPRLNSITFQPNIFPDDVESIECPVLKKIKLFDLIHSEEVMNRRPKFSAPALETLILVGLKGSDKVFGLDDVLYHPGEHTRLKKLHIISLTDSFCEEYPLKLTWPSLLSSSMEYVHRLVVSGIIPSFVHDVSSSIDVPMTSSFYQLRSIAIDLLPFCQDIFKSQVTAPLDFSNSDHFPALRRVYLMLITERIDGGFQMVVSTLKKIELKLPDTVKILDVGGSVLENSRSLCILVNGREISLPSQSPVARCDSDMFFRWKKASTGYGGHKWKQGSTVRHKQTFWDYIDEQR